MDPVGLEAYRAALAEGWADPRRLHAEGRRARLLLDTARQTIAEELACRPEEVHLSPSHTASLHGAVQAVTLGRRRTGSGIVVSAVERAAVHAAARFVSPGDDEVRVVPVGRDGRVDLERWGAELARTDVALAALQHANGEVGTLQPLARAYETARAAGVPLLVDAGASLGHVHVGPGWDLLAADPADWGAPPGVAVLAVRSRIRAGRAWPEDADRWFPGGVDVPAAYAAAVTLRAARERAAAADAHRRALVDQIRRAAAQVPDVEVVGDPDDRLPHVVTFSCLYVDGEALVTELDRRGFAVGSGSACTSSTLEPSHVLAAMGVLTHGNVRVTLPATVRAEDVERFCAELPEAVAHVRQMLGVEGL